MKVETFFAYAQVGFWILDKTVFLFGHKVIGDHW